MWQHTISSARIGKHLPPALQERIILTSAVALLFIAGYASTGHLQSASNAHELNSFLDDRIPFFAPAVWIYLWGFPWAFLPAFLVQPRAVFRRTAAAYAFVILASLVLFTLFPVTSIHLRAPANLLSESSISDWAVLTLYSIDPPVNLFPSLHVSMASVATLSMARISRVLAAFGLLSTVLIAFSACLIKQHCLADIIGGAALASFIWTLLFRGSELDRTCRRAISEKGVLLFVVASASIYLLVWLAFICREQPAH